MKYAIWLIDSNDWYKRNRRIVLFSTKFRARETWHELWKSGVNCDYYVYAPNAPKNKTYFCAYSEECLNMVMREGAVCREHAYDQRLREQVLNP